MTFQRLGFWEEFSVAKPRILGGMFDVLSRALKTGPDKLASAEFRMSDFAGWGCAIARAMGEKPNAFIAAYRRNREHHNEEALNNSPVALAVLELVGQNSIWEGTPSELYRRLTDVARFELHMAEHGSNWPKAPQFLTKRLNEIKPNLRRMGVIVSDARAQKRTIRIERLAASGGIVGSVDTATPGCDDVDATDDGAEGE